MDVLRNLVDSPRFHRAVLVLILANAALMGIETSRELMARHLGLFTALNAAVQVAFVAEITLRLAAHGRTPWRFFRDGWNVFDFVVVAASLLPAAGPLATLARLARVLRAVRLVSALPELRLIVGTMLRSIPSLGHVTMLLSLLLYVYGVLGCHLFGDDAPEQWGTLGAALRSLFQVVTLEGWVEMQDAVLPGHPLAWVFFSSFIVVAVFVVINLFIAVVINNLEATRQEQLGRGAEADLVRRLELRRRD
jgi:voltage-gated sodium channel